MPVGLVAAGVGAAGAIAGSAISSSGSKKIANTQAAAAANANAEQAREFDQTQANYAPYLAAGTQALGQQGNLVGTNGAPAQQSAISALQASPYYQSLYNSGANTVLQNASATGGLRGGNVQNSLATFGSKTLSDAIQQQLANLSGLSGMGQSSTAQLAGAGQNYANAYGQNAISGANAQAGGIFGGAASAINGINQVSGLTQKYLGSAGGFGGGYTPFGTETFSAPFSGGFAASNLSGRATPFGGGF